MAFKLRKVSLEFLEDAPKRWRFTAPMSVQPEAVFTAISADPSTWRWFPGMTGGAYDGPGPHGVGSTREVRQGPSVYRETIMAWDFPTRWVYRVDEMTVPLAHALVEEWAIRQTDDGSAVRWTLAIEPRALFTALLPVAPLGMGRIFRRAMRNLDVTLRDGDPS
jgi:polyketide cyclase/dehydrase/lipid transport protein